MVNTWTFYLKNEIRICVFFKFPNKVNPASQIILFRYLKNKLKFTLESLCIILLK